MNFYVLQTKLILEGVCISAWGGGLGVASLATSPEL
jgi:hypothetical protein